MYSVQMYFVQIYYVQIYSVQIYSVVCKCVLYKCILQCTHVFGSVQMYYVHMHHVVYKIILYKCIVQCTHVFCTNVLVFDMYIIVISSQKNSYGNTFVHYIIHLYYVVYTCILCKFILQCTNVFCTNVFCTNVFCSVQMYSVQMYYVVYKCMCSICIGILITLFLRLQNLFIIYKYILK